MMRYSYFATVGLLLSAALLTSSCALGEMIRPSRSWFPAPVGAPAAAAATPVAVAAPVATPATVAPIAPIATPAPVSAYASAAVSPPAAISTPAAPPAPKPVVEPDRRSALPVSPDAVVYGDRVLSEDTFWRGEVLVEGVVAVAPQATLSVEPGTVVRFRRKGAQAPLLVVQGRLVAVGTKEAPVQFTSNFADPVPGDWQGIMFLGSEKKNLLENCRIEGAETGIEALFTSLTLKAVHAGRAVTGMRFQDSVVTMDGGGASGCDTALRFADSEATLRNLSVAGNRLGLVALRSSLYLFEASLSGNQAAAFTGDACRVKLQGGTVLGNGSGVTLIACEGSVTGARLVKNREFGLSLAASRIRVTGNVISGNGNNGVIAADGAAVLWDNAIYENAGYDLYNAGVEEFRAPGNWWGGTNPKVFDNGGRGRVLYAPVLGARPQKP